MGRIFQTITATAIFALAGLNAAAQEPTEASCQAAYEQALVNINTPIVLPERERISDGNALYVSSEPPGPFVMEGVRGPTAKRKAVDAAGEAYRECLMSVPLPPNPDGTCPFGTYPVEVTPPQSFVAFDSTKLKRLKYIASLKATKVTPQQRAQILQKSPTVNARLVRPTLEAKTARPAITARIGNPNLEAKPARPKPAPKELSPAVNGTVRTSRDTIRATAKPKAQNRQLKLEPALAKRLKVSPTLMKAPKLKVENYKFEKIATDKIKQRESAGAKIKCLREETNSSILFSVIQIRKLHMTGEPIKVAFDGGSQGMRTAIYSIAQQWASGTADPVTGERLIDFDFGTFNSTGLLEFHEWSPEDRLYTAHIRISFDPADGYWSYIGTDSGNPDVVLPGEPSMNLAGMDGYSALPRDWVKTIFHEFGHALGLEHEHQHPSSVCGDALRLEDDADYTLAFDALGTAVADQEGRRPGVLTYLEHYPNYWPREDAVFNLSQLQEDDERFTTAFDPNSIMRYEFPSNWYSDLAPDECLPTGVLPAGPSQTDFDALRIAYTQQLCTDPENCNGIGSGPFASPESP